jgi:hypothetical protein
MQGDGSCCVDIGADCDIGVGFDSVVEDAGYEMLSGEAGIGYFERRRMSGRAVYPLWSRGLIMRVV